MVRFDVNGMACVVLNVGEFVMPPNVLFGHAPEEDVAAALARHGLDPEAIMFQMNPLVVDTGAHRVIIDPAGLDHSARLPVALEAAGIDPASIDTVVITHGHSDHFNGGVTQGGAAAFPNARYVIQRKEWEHWFADDNPEPHHVENFRKTLGPLADRFALLDGEGPIVPGIEARLAPGHSPGQMVVLVGGQMVVVADAFMSPVQVEYPDWVATFDVWPDLVAQTRRALLQRIADEQWAAFVFHLPVPGLGRVTKDGDRFKWEFVDTP